MSTASNLVLTVAVARHSDRAEFGQFALVFSAYLIILSQGRGIASDPLLVRSAELHTSDEWGPSVAGTTSSAGIVGLIAAILIFGIILALHSTNPRVITGYGTHLWYLLAIGAPFLLVQDAWRNVHFASRQPRSAFTNDFVWTSVLLFIVMVLSESHSLTSATAEIAWIAGAVAASLFGFLQSSTRLSLRASREWIRGNTNLSWRFAGDNFLGGGLLQSTSYIVAGIAGLSAAGAFRGAMTLAGPFTTVLAGINTFLIPWFSARWKDGHANLAVLASSVSCGISIIAALFGAALMMIPSHLGQSLLGLTWPSARSLLLPAIVWTIGLALAQAPNSAIRVMKLASLGLVIRIATCTLIVIGVSLGTSVDAAAGAMWGLGAATCLGASMWIVVAFKSQSEARRRVS